jgi:hypothetical protein
MKAILLAQCPSDVSDDALHLREIMFTVPEAWRPHAHKRDIGILYGLDGICGRM